MRFERLQPFGVVATEWTLEDLSNPEQSGRLVSEWHEAGGLLVLRGRLLEPEALVRVGHTFGEVENMVDTQMRPESIHEDVPEIFLVHNRNFSRAIPARPKDGDHVLQWPQRKGWHSGASLFLAFSLSLSVSLALRAANTHRAILLHPQIRATASRRPTPRSSTACGRARRGRATPSSATMPRPSTR